MDGFQVSAVAVMPPVPSQQERPLNQRHDLRHR
jgi:hypothetical protein